MNLFQRLRRLWALSASGDTAPVIERTERIIERVPVPSATVEDIYVQAVSRLELLPGDILIARLPEGYKEDAWTRAAKTLTGLAERSGAALLMSDMHSDFSVLAFKRAERRLSHPRTKRVAKPRAA